MCVRVGLSAQAEHSRALDSTQASPRLPTRRQCGHLPFGQPAVGSLLPLGECEGALTHAHHGLGYEKGECSRAGAQCEHVQQCGRNTQSTNDSRGSHDGPGWYVGRPSIGHQRQCKGSPWECPIVTDKLASWPAPCQRSKRVVGAFAFSRVVLCYVQC